MRDFIDKTPLKNGTPINRDYLMAIQGFDAITYTFNDDGSITEENKLGEKKTTNFVNDYTIEEKFEGEFTLTKRITFNSDNEIVEELI